MASVSVRVDFFRFGCELVDWVFNVYVFIKLYRGMGGAGDIAARAPLTAVTIASLSTLNVLFYVLCRVPVRFC